VRRKAVCAHHRTETDYRIAVAALACIANSTGRKLTKSFQQLQKMLTAWWIYGIGINCCSGIILKTQSLPIKIFACKRLGGNKNPVLNFQDGIEFEM
jgi:hypothetical protein